MPANAFKTLTKNGVKKFARAVNPLYSRRKSATRILTYHSIGNRDHEMNVTCADFAEQMHWLSEHATVISVDAAAENAPGIAITFDDGYEDNLKNAVPILKKYRFPATVYMVAGRAGETLPNESDPDHSRIMTWDQLRSLESEGIRIGGHTLSHARLSSLSKEEQHHEVGECTRLLNKELSTSIESFAYPYGSVLDYNGDSISAVQQAGYSHAVSNRYGSVQPDSSVWELPRIWIDRSDSIEIFAHKASGRLDVLAVQDTYVGIYLRRGINRLLRVR